MSKKLEYSIGVYTVKGEFVGLFKSLTMASKMTGAAIPDIHKILNGKYGVNQVRGYTFLKYGRAPLPWKIEADEKRVALFFEARRLSIQGFIKSRHGKK